MRLEEKLFRLNEEIDALRLQEGLALEELTVHRHLHDDAVRDASVSEHPIDRADARETATDVSRSERSVRGIQRQVAKLKIKRARMMGRLR